ELYVWLSGARGVIEVLPTRLSSRGTKVLDNFDLGICPYRGLQAFTAEDAAYFYGRESLTQQLVYELRQSAFLAVVGASGSGKSSVVQAGLVAQLQQGKLLPGSEQWEIGIMQPGENPLSALAGCLATLSQTAGLTVEQVEGILHLGVDNFVYFLRSRPEPVLVLVVDQFEELFTLSSRQQRQQFLELVLGALQYACDRLKVVITLRADFLSHALELPGLTEAIQKSSIFVPPQLSAEAYREVIVNPAEQVGLEVEPELIDILLRELDNASGDLPLLEFVLEQLWEHRQNAKLTLQAYLNAIGGLQGALERKAQAVYDSLEPPAQRCAQWIFLSLVQFGEGTQETRRRILKSDLAVPRYPAALREKTLSTLVAAKLIVIQGARENQRAKGENFTPELAIEQPTVEIAHEILIRYWSSLRWWLEENRTRLLKQRQLEQAAQLWLKGFQKPEYLLQGVRLGEAEEIYIEYADELPEEVQRFIEACLAERQRQQQQATRRLRRNQLAVAVISVMAIASTTLAWIAQQQKLAAQLQEIDALNASAEALLASHQQLEALTTSLKAATLFQRLPQKPQFLDTQLKTASTLQQTLSLTQERNRLQVHRQKVNSVAFSPDGQIFASASDDNTVILWGSHGEKLATLTGNARFLSVAFSPDSQTLLTGDASGKVQLWHSDGTLRQTINAHSDWVTCAIFHPNSQQLVSASRDGTLKFWSLEGDLLKTLPASSGWVNDIAWSPDGQVIASAGEDGKIQLWDNQGQLIKSWQADDDRVTSIQFSPDGEVLAAGGSHLKLWNRNGELQETWETDSELINSLSWDKTGEYLAVARGNRLQVWDREGSLKQILNGHGAEVLGVSWHPDAAVIVSGSTDKTVRLWTLNPIAAGEAVDKIAFSSDGQLFASAGWEGEINIYTTKDQQLILQIPATELSPISSLAFSRDRQYIAASGENLIQIWQVSNGQPVFTLQGHQDRVTTIQFSPNGQQLASGSEDATVKLWSVAEGRLLNTLTGHTDGVTSLSWKATGDLLASGSYDQTVRIWRSEGSGVQTWEAHGLGVSAIAFSPHANLLATASWDNTIKLWTLQGELQHTLTGHNSGITSLDWHPTGKILASSSADGTIKLWNSGILLKTLLGDAASVHQVLFSPQGNVLLSAGEGTGANLQELNLVNLVLQSCSQLQGYLNANLSTLEENQSCGKANSKH
ncbi:MAG: WD40 repeat domain-containing protein, partial [Desertifilum sp. SIO1I2]|nr:WD40 repeat domain-containing protein [Desertifilum sp. SIO1I2]